MFIKLNLGTDENTFKVFRSEDILSIEPSFPPDNENVCFFMTPEQAHDLSRKLNCATIAHPSEYM
jgi:hypothetical protein